jgi:hypothetical protein
MLETETGKNNIARCGELASEMALEFSYDTLQKQMKPQNRSQNIENQRSVHHLI